MKRTGKILLVYSAGLLLIATSAYAVWTLAHSARTGWIGAYLDAEQGKIALVVVPGGPANEARLKNGLDVITVDGRYPSEEWLRQLSATLHPGDDVTLGLNGPQGSQNVRLRAASPLRTPVVATLAACGLAMAFAFWFAGFSFYRLDGKSGAGLLFYIYSLVTASIYVFSASSFSFVSSLDPFWRLRGFESHLLEIPGAVQTLAMALLFHFSFAFPVNRPRLRRPAILEPIYGLIVLPLALAWSFDWLTYPGPDFRSWFILGALAWIGLLAWTGRRRGWRFLFRHPGLLFPLAYFVGAIAIIESSVMDSGALLGWIMKVLYAFPGILDMPYLLGTCIILAAGFWQIRSTERRTTGVAALAMILALVLGIFINRIPLPASGAFGMTGHDLRWFLSTSGILRDVADLLIPLGVAAMLWKRPQKARV